MNKFKFLIVSGCVLLTSLSHAKDCEKSPLKNSQQIVLNIADDSETIHSQTYLFEKDGKKFKKINPEGWKSVLGRSGLAQGRGLHPEDKKAIYKKEGDGKAPSGIFELTSSFGHHEKIQNKKFPYQHVDHQSFCIDDVRHADYNHLKHSFDIKAEAKKLKMKKISSENLQEVGPAYEYAVVVNHNNINSKKAEKGAGSCIFLHVWKRNENNKVKPTAGCTAYAQEHMKTLINWLDIKKKPLLVQLTKAEYEKNKTKWCLPQVSL
ncbi:MAG: hypothetical protein CME62_06375 [Halobacteriovoraceae bacterium]|nr:hypothetical protein [Halobacteriovoraceae bacterium]|tara:strand:- start:6738 stop:7529 length:792 start_codon:yes stop_codon:yes gene_type:complete